MSAFGPKRTWRIAVHMSAFGGKADMTVCGSSLSRSLLGVKRTCLFALQMSARFNRSKTVQAQHCSIWYGEHNGHQHRNPVMHKAGYNPQTSKYFAVEKTGNMRLPVEPRTETGETYERNYGWGCAHGCNCHARIRAGILCLLGHGQCDRSAAARED